MNRLYLFLISIFLSSYALAYEVTENLQVHGFFTQSGVYTSDNNMYGNSKDSMTGDLREAGLNLFYTPLSNLSFSFQGLYRKAGKVNNDTVDVDYAFMDINLKNYASGRYGLRLGRIKNPIGLYNETRDVAFTTPSIILPQGIYFDRSRSLLLSSDGGQLYWEHLTENGTFNLKASYGVTRNDNDELLKAIIPYPTSKYPFPEPQGELEPSGTIPSFLTQISYEQNGGEYIYAFSFADAELKYNPKGNEPYQKGSTHFNMYVLSAQYNGEKITLTGEYKYQKNEFKDFGVLFPDVSPVSESWYIQAAYRLKYNWQLYGRYDEYYSDKDNRNGSNTKLVGNPAHMSYAKSAMLGIRWDINTSMMLRAEYHNIDGSNWLTSADNPDRSQTERYWDLFALQFSVRF